MTLRALREAAGLKNLSEAAERTGLDYTTIGKLEAGQIRDPRVTTCEKLAAAYGRTVTEVIDACRASVEARGEEPAA